MIKKLEKTEPVRDINEKILRKQTSNIIRNIYYNKSKLPNYFIDSQFVSITPSLKSEHTQLTIFFFQDKKQIGTIGVYAPARVSIEMPNKIMKRFLNEMKDNPDILEQLYQKAFIGLDKTRDNPGMRRIPSNQFFLLENHEEIPDIDRYYSESKLMKFVETTNKFSYKNGPYGSGNAIPLS